MRKMEHAMYFAYGSNMNLDQMAYRCPAAEAVCTAKLEGYELFFAGRPGNGVASIRPKQGGTVVGVLWKLTEACEKSLDHYEGFPALYGKETVRVRGSDGTEHRVTAYTMQEPYSFSAEFFYRLFKRMRKYNAFITAISQNVDEILRSDTARLMLANSELLVMLNQAATDREELAKLLNISENQLSYITNVPAGHGLIRCGGAIIPFENSFPKNTKLYQLMTTKPNEKFE